MSKPLWLILLMGLTLVGVAVLLPAPEYDTVIRGGRVIDGTGNPAYFADVAIKDGKIVLVGVVDGKGQQEIDAQGKVVSPGFIDVHTHAENIEKLPLAENFARMGVTTLVMGNCGGSEYPLGGFFSKLEKGGISVNVASFVGHNTVRRLAMGGNANRPPTPEELSKMKDAVELAMKDGAVGLSTGLIYLPGTYSKTDEIVELAKVVKLYKGMYVSHMRSEGLKIMDAIDELLTVGRESGVRCELSHIKLSGNAMWGKAREVIEKLEKARSEGIDVTQDQYVYTASSTGMSQLIPDEYLEKGAEEFKKLIGSQAKKEEIASKMRQNLANNQRSDYSYAVIASYSKDKSLNGKSIPEAAKMKYGKNDLDAQIDMVFELYVNGGASGVFHGMSEDDLRAFLTHPNTAIASDASVRDFGEGVPHPRGYGNNARVLQTYVRDLKLLRLEDAIRKMTSLPAQEMGIVDRGVIRTGMAADLVVFDPAKVRENSTYTEPHQYATGFDWVLVNGGVIVESDKHTQAKPGKVLRSRNGAVLAGVAK